jgi:predicted transcriptional regulator
MITGSWKLSILKCSNTYDIDYSLMVASVLRIPKEEAFERHDKLRNFGLLERVDATMVRYRKNIAPGKWIKHRNHTYYRLTDKGRRYLDLYLNRDCE